MDLSSLRILLLVVLALPLVAALTVLFLGARCHRTARGLSLGFVLLHLALTATLVIPAASMLADPARHSHVGTTGQAHSVFVPELVPGATSENPHETTWELAGFGTGAIEFFVGLDGLNIWLVALTSFLMFPAILATWETITTRANQFYAWLFVLQSAILGVFLAFDIVLFYAFFELTLIPTFFLIGMWGVSSGRREAARKFFLYTLAGSLITLVGMVGVILLVYTKADVLTFSIPELVNTLNQEYQSADPDTQSYWWSAQYYLFMALALGFIIKIPLVPLHSWLPNAYAEAPTSVVMLLSGLLAKMGTYGFVRVVMPMTPDASFTMGLPVLGSLAAIGILYGAFCAFAQSDLKRLVAYSSISHLGFCALALFAFNPEGLTGGILHMVNHGLATAALFLLVGLMIDRYGTGQIPEFSGIWNRLPALTFFMMVIALAGIGLPGLNNFVSEMLMLAGLYELRNVGEGTLTFAAIAAFGIFMSAWYLLTMIQRVFFGPVREPVVFTPVMTREPAPSEQPDQPVTDLKPREYTALVPLGLLILVLGLFPQPVLNVMKSDVEALSQVGEDARLRTSSILTIAQRSDSE